MKEKIKKVVSQLAESTINGSITWEVRKSTFSSEKTHKFRAYSTDKDTWFDIEISLDDTMSMQKGAMLWIYNAGLIDGRKLLSQYEYPDIHRIELFIYNSMVKPNITKILEDDAFDKILAGIGDKQSMRDKKIGEILSDFNPFKKLW